jgi:uncharacterized membrane-anchored protein YjiN (DUF445 family)
MRGAFILNS